MKINLSQFPKDFAGRDEPEILAFVATLDTVEKQLEGALTEKGIPLPEAVKLASEFDSLATYEDRVARCQNMQDLLAKAEVKPPAPDKKVLTTKPSPAEPFAPKTLTEKCKAYLARKRGQAPAKEGLTLTAQCLAARGTKIDSGEEAGQPNTATSRRSRIAKRGGFKLKGLTAQCLLRHGIKLP